MNLDQAEQWANGFPVELVGYDHPLVPLMAEYHRRGQELERLTAVITRYETGAQQIVEKLNQGMNR